MEKKSRKRIARMILPMLEDKHQELSEDSCQCTVANLREKVANLEALEEMISECRRELDR